MPKLHSKEPTLNGKAEIVSYEDREYLYLRIPRGDRKYWNRSLQTTDLKVAHNRALDVYMETVNAPQKSRSKKHLFTTACEKFLAHKHKQSSTGKITNGTASTYEQRFYQRIIPYARVIGLKYVGEIGKTTFDDYATYYRQVKTKGKWKTSTRGLAISTINSDITTLNEMMKWCIRYEIVELKNWVEVERWTDDKDHREDSNPAYMPDDWEVIKQTLFDWENAEVDPIKKWKKCWYKNWVMFMYHGGFRCHEARSLTLADVEIVRRNGKVRWGVVRVPPSTKTGKRISIMNGNWLNSVRHHLNKGIKLRNEQIKDHNLKVEEGTLERWRKCKTKIELLPSPPKMDMPLFANPFGYFAKTTDDDKITKINITPPTDETIRQKLHSLFKDLEFYQKKDYTLHSLRSTHITHALLVKDMDMQKIADNVGTSKTEIENTYYLLNNLLIWRNWVSSEMRWRRKRNW